MGVADTEFFRKGHHCRCSCEHASTHNSGASDAAQSMWVVSACVLIATAAMVALFEELQWGGLASPAAPALNVAAPNIYSLHRIFWVGKVVRAGLT